MMELDVLLYIYIRKMKGRKTQQAEKNPLKGSTSRQALKLQAISTPGKPRKGSQHAIPHNNPKKIDSLRPDNSKSSLLRQLKAHSLKPEEDTHPPTRTILQKLDNNDRRKEQSSLESKDNCRSFMIRKKNISSYARKMEEDLTKYEIELLGLPLTHEHVLDPQLYPHFHSNTNSTHDIKDYSHPPISSTQQQKQLLRSSLLNHTTGLKVKPIICKPMKQRDRSDSHGKEEPDRMQKQIEKMIKKVRNSSKSDYQPGSSELHPNSKGKAGATENDGSSKAKEKGFNGCKTIRIAWGKENSDKVGGLPDRDDVFGGISVITHCKEAQIESLKELFRELNHNHAEIPTVVSKELIEF